MYYKVFYSVGGAEGRGEMEQFSDVCELYGLLLVSSLYMASGISSYTWPGQLPVEDTEKPSVRLSGTQAGQRSPLCYSVL